MSDPIKGPGAPGVRSPLAADPSAAPVEGETRLEQAAEPGVDSAGEGVALTGELATLEAAHGSGALDTEALIERLLDRAMATTDALPEVERAALEAELRTALSEDPTLLELQKDLRRATKAPT